MTLCEGLEFVQSKKVRKKKLEMFTKMVELLVFVVYPLFL